MEICVRTVIHTGYQEHVNAAIRGPSGGQSKLLMCTRKSDRMTFSSLKPGAKRTCKNRACRNKFVPTERHPFAIACCTGCEIILAKQHIEKVQAARAKKERKELKVRKESMKSRQQWLREATAAFNAFIRTRDWDQPCISCGRFHDGSYDAGHYRTVGSMPALRFHEDNCHKQCVPCNQHKAGNVVEYRLRLIERIGADRVAFLEGPHEPAKYTIEDAKQIKTEYKGKLKALQGLMGVGE
jgi:hypothetical protein